MFEGLFQQMLPIMILMVVLVIFGPGTLPELDGSIGKALKGFTRAMYEPDWKPEAVSASKKMKDKKA